MPETIRYHLDEHVPRAVAQALRRKGIDVTMAVEVGLQGASDLQQIQFALAESRMIFAEDYLSLHTSGVERAGIAYCKQDSRSIGDIIRGLVLIWAVLDPQSVRGTIEYL